MNNLFEVISKCSDYWPILEHFEMNKVVKCSERIFDDVNYQQDSQLDNLSSEIIHEQKLIDVDSVNLPLPE